MKMAMKIRAAGVVVGMAALLGAAAAARAGDGQPRVRPVVHAPSGYLLGGTVNGAWRDGKTVARLLRGGERYRVYGRHAALGTSTGRRPVAAEPDICPETYRVRFSPARAGAQVALGGAGNALPRPVVRLDAAAPVYREAVRQLLVRRGIPRPDVRVTGIVRADLEGDGRDEVIVSATRGDLRRGIRVDAGDYSLLFVRTLVDGAVRTVMLNDEYHPTASNEKIINAHTVAGVLDVDGDGAYEIVTYSRYYEGDWATLHRVRNGRKQELATAGCGV